MKFRLFSTVLLATVILGAIAIPSGATTTPYSRLIFVIDDAEAKQSVHLTAHASISGKRFVQVTDAGRSVGRQTNTLTISGQSNTVVVELVAGILYVKGDATILTTFMGLSQSTSKQLANKWFMIKPSNSDYGVVALGLTVDSAITQILMTRSVAAKPATTLSGVKVDVLKGVTIATTLEPLSGETLYFTAAKDPLPVEATQTYQGSFGTILFSHWNETIHIVAPKTTLQLT